MKVKLLEVLVDDDSEGQCGVAIYEDEAGTLFAEPVRVEQ